MVPTAYADSIRSSVVMNLERHIHRIMTTAGKRVNDRYPQLRLIHYASRHTAHSRPCTHINTSRVDAPNARILGAAEALKALISRAEAPSALNLGTASEVFESHASTFRMGSR